MQVLGHYYLALALRHAVLTVALRDASKDYRQYFDHHLRREHVVLVRGDVGPCGDS